MNHRLPRVVIAGWLALAVLGCGSNPRPDDPSATQPDPPTSATKWTALDWHTTTFEQPGKVSIEQWDQAVAVAAGPLGFVGVGSNSDVMGYVGRIWQSTDSFDWKLEDHHFLDGLELVDIAATTQTYVAIGTKSGNPNEPIATILVSSDGLTWIETESIEGSWASSVSAGPAGFAVVLEVDDSTDLLFSPDGQSWTRTAGNHLAEGAWIADIAWDRGAWLAVGWIGTRAAAYRSTDGPDWIEERLPESEPVDGILDVSAYRVVPGRWGTLILGLDREPSCAEDDDWCGKYQASWSWTDQTGWSRLPNSTWINGLGYGVDAFPAGDAGFLYMLGDAIRLSADGWEWNPVKETSPSDAFPADAVVLGERVVAVGIPAGVDDDLVGWFGSAAISR